MAISTSLDRSRWPAKHHREPSPQRWMDTHQFWYMLLGLCVVGLFYVSIWLLLDGAWHLVGVMLQHARP